MKLNEVKEIGFYKAIKDERPNYIFEVIKNTDEEWLKDNPKATLLIDEWGYEYIDGDDRRHYETFGNLIIVQNADEIEVEKMTENFVVSGKVGNHLTEDKPTYKEKCKKIADLCKAEKDKGFVMSRYGCKEPVSEGYDLACEILKLLEIEEVDEKLRKRIYEKFN